MTFHKVQDATNFGFRRRSIESWQGLSNTEVPLPTADDDFFAAEAFMINSMVRKEARRVLAEFARHQETSSDPKPFEEWIDMYIILHMGSFMDGSNPMSRSTSLMSNLHDQMRSAFWNPLIIEAARWMIPESQ